MSLIIKQKISNISWIRCSHFYKNNYDNIESLDEKLLLPDYLSDEKLEDVFKAICFFNCYPINFFDYLTLQNRSDYYKLIDSLNDFYQPYNVVMLEKIKLVITKERDFLSLFAASENHLDILKWCHKRGFIEKNKETIEASLISRNFKCFEFLMEAIYYKALISVNDLFEEVCDKNSSEFIDYLYNKFGNNYPKAILSTVKKNDKIALKYLIELKFLFNDEIFEIAIKNDFYDILSYFISNKFIYRKESSKNLVKIAVENNSIKCLEILSIEKFHIDKEMLKLSIEKNSYDCFKFLFENHNSGYYSNHELSVFAAKNGNIKYFSFKEICDSISSLTFIAAGKYGNLECLKFLHSKSSKWDDDMVRIAHDENHLDCVEYAIKNGCPFDKRLILLSVYSNSIDNLKNDLSCGLPWHDGIITISVNFDCFNFLDFIVENQIKFNPKLIINATAKSKKYIKDNLDKFTNLVSENMELFEDILNSN